MNGKDRAQELREGILRSLLQLGHIPGNNTIQSIHSNDSLLKDLLYKQLKIIHTQSKLLEQSRGIVQELKAKNEKLLIKCKELKSRKSDIGNKSVEKASRASSPIFDTENDHFVSQSFYHFQPQKIRKKGVQSCFRHKVRHETRRIRELFQKREASYMKGKDQVKKLEKITDNSFSNAILPKEAESEPLSPRKTRSTGGPEDLLPLQDFSWKRKRNSNHKECPSAEFHIEEHKQGHSSGCSVILENCIKGEDTSSLSYAPTLYLKRIKETGLQDTEHRNIEVPSWRLNTILPSRKLSESEPLDDDTFLRRHWKLEVDEKRRKRWDAQKAREDSYIQQLKGRNKDRTGMQSEPGSRNSIRGRTHQSKDDSMDDDEIRLVPFITGMLTEPDLSLISYIEIENTLPINVFGGIPLPPFKQQNFSLPWEPGKLQKITRGRKTEYTRKRSMDNGTRVTESASLFF